MEVGNVEILNLEIERLTRELDQTNSEKIQSAQYGIVLLEEKENLQHRCEELESHFENARHELALTREVTFYAFYLNGLHHHIPCAITLHICLVTLHIKFLCFMHQIFFLDMS